MGKSFFISGNVVAVRQVAAPVDQLGLPGEPSQVLLYTLQPYTLSLKRK